MPQREVAAPTGVSDDRRRKLARRLPDLDEDQFQPIDPAALFDVPRAAHPPRILMLYGSLRERSYSRLATEEAGRILRKLGAEVRIFNSFGLPLPGSTPPTTRRSRSCVSCPYGPRGRFGARLSVTAP